MFCCTCRCDRSTQVFRWAAVRVSTPPCSAHSRRRWTTSHRSCRPASKWVVHPQTAFIFWFNCFVFWKSGEGLENDRPLVVLWSQAAITAGSQNEMKNPVLVPSKCICTVHVDEGGPLGRFAKNEVSCSGASRPSDWRVSLQTGQGRGGGESMKGLMSRCQRLNKICHCRHCRWTCCARSWSSARNWRTRSTTWRPPTNDSLTNWKTCERITAGVINYLVYCFQNWYFKLSADSLTVSYFWQIAADFTQLYRPTASLLAAGITVFMT